MASARSNLLPRHTEQGLLARASMAVALNLATAPAAHTARLDALQRRARRGHVITQHGLIATGPLAGPQLRLHRTQGSDRSQAQVTHRAIATAQSLRTPGI